MDRSTFDAALASLEDHLKTNGAAVRRLSAAAVGEARARWRAAFGPTLGRRRWSWTREGYDWHVFSFERHESLEGAVATEAFTHSTANVHRFVVLAAVDGVDVALEVTSDRAIDLEPLGEDWTMVADDGSWSMSWTSEVEGPYFARP